MISALRPRYWVLEFAASGRGTSNRTVRPPREKYQWSDVKGTHPCWYLRRYFSDAKVQEGYVSGETDQNRHLISGVARLTSHQRLVPIEYGLEHQRPSLFRADINDASDLIEEKVMIGMSRPSLRTEFARNRSPGFDSEATSDCTGSQAHCSCCLSP